MKLKKWARVPLSAIVGSIVWGWVELLIWSASIIESAPTALGFLGVAIIGFSGLAIIVSFGYAVLAIQDWWYFNSVGHVIKHWFRNTFMEHDE